MTLDEWTVPNGPIHTSGTVTYTVSSWISDGENSSGPYRNRCPLAGGSLKLGMTIGCSPAPMSSCTTSPCTYGPHCPSTGSGYWHKPAWLPVLRLQLCLFRLPVPMGGESILLSIVDWLLNWNSAFSADSDTGSVLGTLLGARILGPPAGP